MREGLQFDIDRTKVSGAGKRTGSVTAFVSYQCSVSGKHWLRAWREFFVEGEFAFERDYLVPVVTHDLSRAKRQPAEYHELQLYSATLLFQLRRPVADEFWYQGRAFGAWALGEERLLQSPLWSAFRGHSERNKLNRVAAYMGISKEQRDYLGRWKADGSDNYLATSKFATMSIQDKAFACLRHDL